VFFYELMDTQQATKGEATPNKGALQSYIQNFTKEAIDCIVEIMHTSRNEALKMGAAKVIIDKSIADLKAMEVGGVNGEPIKFTIIGGADYTAYISGLNKTTATSTTGIIGGSNEVQDINLAQTGEKNNNGNNPVS
jgi:hypothetical protein